MKYKFEQQQELEHSIFGRKQPTFAKDGKTLTAAYDHMKVYSGILRRRAAAAESMAAARITDVQISAMEEAVREIRNGFNAAQKYRNSVQ